MARRKRVTVREVAAAAGVSLGSVSRVFNNHNVDPEIAERVRSTAKELGYVHKGHGNQSKGMESIALVLVGPNAQPNTWTLMIAFEFLSTMGDYGYRPTVVFVERHAEEAPDAITGCAGCIVWGTLPESFYVSIAKKHRGIPVVAYSNEVPYERSISLLIDQGHTMTILTEYLIAQNHREIGFITNPLQYAPNHGRLVSFQETLGEFGCTFKDKWVVDVADKMLGPETELIHKGYAATEFLLKQKKRPSAIIYSSDSLAFAGMEALRVAGLTLPDDMSIVGTDNLPHCETTVPKLTTAGLRPGELGVAAMDGLEKLINNRPHEKVIRLQRHLIKRHSVSLRR